MKDFKIRQSEADQRLDVFLAEKLAADLEIQTTEGAEVRLAVLFPPS